MNGSQKKIVAVGMSGGVDSSVAAYLLKKQGYHVIGLFMKNWEDEEEEDFCPAAEDYADVVSVCHQLDIPYYSLNFAKEYWEEVFSTCLKEFSLGYTPNPDILCNREIKFKVFLNKALQDLQADYLATGHYCKKRRQGDKWTLLRGEDANKDQSYFLYTLKSELMEKILFPIGELKKSEVRNIAKDLGLTTALKKDSTGICFIGKRDFKTFLSRYISKKPGNFETLSGTVAGRHEGISYYTIGQRKGLNIGGAGEAWYVVGKDPERNVVLVEQGENHPALFKRELFAIDVNWIAEKPVLPLRCTAKIRYRSEDVFCLVHASSDDRLHVIFDEPQKAITKRQSIVFYQGEVCLGGAIID